MRMESPSPSPDNHHWLLRPPPSPPLQPSPPANLSSPTLEVFQPASSEDPGVEALRPFRHGKQAILFPSLPDLSSHRSSLLERNSEWLDPGRDNVLNALNGTDGSTRQVFSISDAVVCESSHDNCSLGNREKSRFPVHARLTWSFKSRLGAPSLRSTATGRLLKSGRFLSNPATARNPVGPSNG